MIYLKIEGKEIMKETCDRIQSGFWEWKDVVKLFTLYSEIIYVTRFLNRSRIGKLFE